MSDIRTTWAGFVQGADYALEGAGFAEDGGLGTAVILSLFSDRRADPEDDLPERETDPRGWWGDIEPLAADYVLGSRLWLLGRDKESAETLAKAKLYTEEALAWLITSGAAAAVDVTASVLRRGVLLLEVGITRPDRTQQTWQYTWDWMGSNLNAV